MVHIARDTICLGNYGLESFTRTEHFAMKHYTFKMFKSKWNKNEKTKQKTGFFEDKKEQLSEAPRSRRSLKYGEEINVKYPTQHKSMSKRLNT